MKRLSRSLLFKLLTVASPFLPAVCIAVQSSTFSVKALPNIAGGTRTSVLGINNAGDAVGVVGGGSSACPAGCLAVWISGTPTILGSVPGATGGGAYSINNSDQAAGIEVVAGNQLAVIWNNGTPTLLQSPGSQYNQTFAFSINDAGQVVGQAVGQVGGSVVAVATEWNGLTPTVLGLVPGYTIGEAYGINNNGVVVGKLCCDIQEPEAVIWANGTASLLPRLKPVYGAHGAVASGTALAINNSGVIVGQAAPAASLGHAAAWSSGTVTDLGTLGNGSRSSATAVDAQGIIVGESATVDASEPHAAIWSRIGAEIEDLNTLISTTAAADVVLTGATGINDSCVIVANGYNKKTGAPTALLLTLIDASNCVNGL
jgi:probable HAF family extracellular repeat protein